MTRRRRPQYNNNKNDNDRNKGNNNNNMSNLHINENDDIHEIKNNEHRNIHGTGVASLAILKNVTNERLMIII